MANASQPVRLEDLVAGDWVWMPLVVWKHETGWVGATYFTPGPAEPPPPEVRRWLEEYSVASWACWPEAQEFTVGERIEVEMEYTRVPRNRAFGEHFFYRREFDLSISLRNGRKRWAMPRLVISHRNVDSQQGELP